LCTVEHVRLLGLQMLAKAASALHLDAGKRPRREISPVCLCKPSP
jgi:hypothetical protein